MLYHGLFRQRRYEMYVCCGDTEAGSKLPAAAEVWRLDKYTVSMTHVLVQRVALDF